MFLLSSERSGACVAGGVKGERGDVPAQRPLCLWSDARPHAAGIQSCSSRSHHMDTAQQKLGDPYAPPTTVVDAGVHRSERSRWVAVLLAVLSPVVAMCYVGAGWRALAYLAISLGLLPVSITLTTFSDIPMPIVEVIGALALR